MRLKLSPSNMVYNVIVIGSGPAGLTAALYTARAQLNPLVIRGEQPGGQLTTTTEVENFPGFENGIMGPDLMETMEKQAKRFGAEMRYAVVTSVDFESSPKKLTLDTDEVLEAHSVIVSTGAKPRMLGLDSEQTYWAKGVSTCATCDGFFFRGKPVAVVGGGDSACEEALYLANMCKHVHLIHRRDELRASKIMAQRVVEHENITVHWNHHLDEVLGDGSVTTAVRLRSALNSEETKEVEVDGVFIAIGHIPNTTVFKGALNMDENGYLLLSKPNSSYSSAEGVFVCGDCVDHVYRQAVTAAGTGCMAAIDAERWLQSAGH